MTHEEYQRLTMEMATLGKKISTLDLKGDVEAELDRQDIVRYLRHAWHFLQDIKRRQDILENPDSVDMRMTPKKSEVHEHGTK